MTYAEELKEKLFNKKVNGWFKISEELKKEKANFCELSDTKQEEKKKKCRKI